MKKQTAPASAKSFADIVGYWPSVRVLAVSINVKYSTVFSWRNGKQPIPEKYWGAIRASARKHHITHPLNLPAARHKWRDALPTRRHMPRIGGSASHKLATTSLPKEVCASSDAIASSINQETP